MVPGHLMAEAVALAAGKLVGSGHRHPGSSDPQSRSQVACPKLLLVPFVSSPAIG